MLVGGANACICAVLETDWPHVAVLGVRNDNISVGVNSDNTGIDVTSGDTSLGVNNGDISSSVNGGNVSLGVGSRKVNVGVNSGNIRHNASTRASGAGLLKFVLKGKVVQSYCHLNSRTPVNDFLLVFAIAIAVGGVGVALCHSPRQNLGTNFGHVPSAPAPIALPQQTLSCDVRKFITLMIVVN